VGATAAAAAIASTALAVRIFDVFPAKHTGYIPLFVLGVIVFVVIEVTSLGHADHQ
jgi:hypothetical protein